MAMTAMSFWPFEWIFAIAPDPMQIGGDGQAAQLNHFQGSEARSALFGARFRF
jgi:hypothetical protein